MRQLVSDIATDIATDIAIDITVGSTPTWQQVQAALFGNGEAGAYFPIHDLYQLGRLYQDTAGTIPADAVDDPVGRVDDLSGNGNNATQGTSTARPLLKQDENGIWYLQFDGTDDFLSIEDTDDLDFGQGSFWAAAAVNISGTGWRVIWGKGSGLSPDNIRLFASSADRLTVFWGDNNQSYGAPNVGPISRSVNAVWEWGVESSTPAVVTANNGAEASVAITLSGTGSNSLDARIMQDTQGSYITAGRVYGMIIRKGDNTDNEKSLGREFLNSYAQAY